MNKLIIGFVVLAATISITTLSYAEPLVDGPIARNKLMRDVKALLWQERFDELEKLAKELRSTKVRFPEGHWKLEYFYEGLSAPKGRNKERWSRWFDRMEKWQRSFPESVTARVAAGTAWMEYGWEARGGGFADKVTAEGWQKLSECTDKALALASRAPIGTDEDCPQRHHLMLIIGISRGWDRASFFATFDRAIKFEPQYYSYYADAMTYLAPRWHGKEQEWVSFIEKADFLAGKKGDREIYTRMAVGAWKYEWQAFDDSTVSWQKMKKGFQEMEQKYPASEYNLNNFARFACLARDKDMSKELFNKINNHPYIEAWSKTHRTDEYTKCKDWARGDIKQNTPEEKPSFNGGTEDFRQILILAKEDDAEAQYQLGNMLNHGELVKKNLAEAESWFLKSSKQGHRDAQESLAMLYFNGWEPIERNFKKAAQWYYIAAIQGDSNAASLLGLMYKDGFGLEQDLIKAYVWYSQVTQWQEPKVKEIAAKLTPEQLAKADLEANKIREKIRINMKAAEIRPIDPDSIQVPEFKLAPQIKYVVVPQLKLPTGNLMDGVKWQLSGGATFDGKTLSIKSQGEAATQLNVVSSSNGCVLVATRLRHARPEAIVPGTPFLEANMTDGKFESQRIFMGLLAPPPNNRKEGPLYKTHEIKATRFDGVKLRFGTAGTQEGSSTEIYDTKVVIFPGCNEANKAGEEYLRK